MQHNPTQSESIEEIVKDGAKAGKYVLFNWYFLSNIGFMILGILAGIEFVVVNVYGSPIHLIISLGLVVLAMLGVRQDLKEMKKRRRKITRSFAIMVFVFVYISAYSDAIMFESEMILNMVAGIGTDEMKEKMNQYDAKLELVGIFMYFPYPIFFYGTDIWNWITKKQKFVNHYQDCSYYVSG